MFALLRTATAQQVKVKNDGAHRDDEINILTGRGEKTHHVAMIGQIVHSMQPQIKRQHSMDGCISGNKAISAHAGVKGKK